MRKAVTNFFATTGISLILLSLFALYFQAHWLLLVTIFQVFLVNILIHLALLTRQKWEFQQELVGSLLDLVIIEGIIYSLSFPFHWNASLWVLLSIGLVIYLISRLLDLFYLGQEAQEINSLIKKRRQ
ncbi:hypothetical protein [Streptococcus mutans]|uniref:hypothetical protein n=1 Tax=Streptococcus mutans TaxID=1309 RepID=UPI000264F174|nr:hypothetical protein [Streptococcus mutans]EMB52509.1 hypothetical protein SMU9_08607 [Streptococcus mutans 1ID3]EMB98863.1 hypothetical protein SMU66_08176 [Streptococcus mutans N34]MBT3148143.1 hypothetical protein [Streptococcus mutans]MBW3480031.1 hypothetical protein [Streptococcus mutans]MCB4931830.1 hypothetical protein [Streptococcus mutans]